MNESFFTFIFIFFFLPIILRLLQFLLPILPYFYLTIFFIFTFILVYFFSRIAVARWVCLLLAYMFGGLVFSLFIDWHPTFSTFTPALDTTQRPYLLQRTESSAPNFPGYHFTYIKYRLARNTSIL